MNKKKFATVITIMLLLTATISAQNSGSINGKVTTADNKPAEGVTVLIKNSAKYAVADNKGAFQIKNVIQGEYTLLVSLTGYKDAEQPITVENGKATSVAVQL